MTLLALEHVHKRYGAGWFEREVLRNVMLQIEQGELAVVWGMRASGRSTLLRIATGIEPPDSGIVRFEGHDLAHHGERLLGEQIGYCQRTLRFTEGERALEYVMVGPLARRFSPTNARVRALRALERVGAERCAKLRAHELSSAEAVRVALARTLALQPQLIVIDEPVKGVELSERDSILALLRSLADEGITVLASTGESTGLSEADAALTIGAGELHSVRAHLAPVLALHPTPRRVSA